MTDKLLCNWCISDKSHCEECFRGSEYKKKVTNADRIRCMSDEELADALTKKADACWNCASDPCA